MPPRASLACSLLTHVTMATISCLLMVVQILGGHLTKDVLQDTHTHTHTHTLHGSVSALLLNQTSSVVQHLHSRSASSCCFSYAHGHWTRGHSRAWRKFPVQKDSRVVIFRSQGEERKEGKRADWEISRRRCKDTVWLYSA